MRSTEVSAGREGLESICVQRPVPSCRPRAGTPQLHRLSQHALLKKPTALLYSKYTNVETSFGDKPITSLHNLLRLF